MIATYHVCAKCDSKNIVKNGKNRCGSQTYKCKDCGCFRVLTSVKSNADIDMNAVSKTYQERNSLRSTGRIFGISHTTVRNYLKKKPKPQPPSRKPSYHRPGSRKLCWRQTRYSPSFSRKKAPFAFGQPCAVIRVKSLVSLSAMEAKGRARSCGESCHMNIKGSIASVTFGSHTIVYLQRIRWSVKRLGKRPMSKGSTTRSGSALVDLSGGRFHFLKSCTC